MEMKLLAYDPARIDTLANRTAESIADLDSVASDDPAAQSAIAAARRISFELGTTWMPYFARLGADTSMISWGSSCTAAAGTTGASSCSAGTANRTPGTVDPQLIDDLLDLVDEIEAGDEEAVADLATLLDGADPEVVEAFLAALGPEAYLALMGQLVHTPGFQDAPVPVDAESRDRLAHQLAGGLGALSPDDLADAMVEYLVDPGGDVRMGEPELVVAFVVENAPADAQLAFATRAVEYEMESGEDLAFNSDSPEIMDGLATVARYSPVQLASGTATLFTDPVAFAAGQVAASREHAIELFADPERRAYLLTREYDEEGLIAITDVFTSATGSVDLYDPANPADPAELEVVSEITGDGLELLAQRDEFQSSNVDDLPPEVSFNMARITAAQQPAFHAAAVLQQEPVPGVDHEDAMWIDTPYGDPQNEIQVAYVSPDTFTNIVGAAGASDEGLLVVREGLNTHHDRIAAWQASRGDEGVEDLTATLDEAALVEGRYTTAIGHTREAMGREEDEAVLTWIRLARGGGFFLQWGADTVAPPLGTVLGISFGEAQLIANEAFATSEQAAESTMTAYASMAADNVVYRYLAPMIEAGLIDTELIPAGSTPMTADQFSSLDPTVRAEFVDDVNGELRDILDESIADIWMDFPAGQLGDYSELLPGDTPGADD